MKVLDFPAGHEVLVDDHKELTFTELIITMFGSKRIPTGLIVSPLIFLFAEITIHHTIFVEVLYRSVNHNVL